MIYLCYSPIYSYAPHKHYHLRWWPFYKNCISAVWLDLQLKFAAMSVSVLTVLSESLYFWIRAFKIFLRIDQSPCCCWRKTGVCLETLWYLMHYFYNHFNINLLFFILATVSHFLLFTQSLPTYISLFHSSSISRGNGRSPVSINKLLLIMLQ